MLCQPQALKKEDPSVIFFLKSAGSRLSVTKVVLHKLLTEAMPRALPNYVLCATLIFHLPEET